MSVNPNFKYSVSQDIAAGVVNVEKLSSEISNSGLVVGFGGIIVRGDEVLITGSDVTDQNALDALVSAHVAVTLDEQKVARKAAVDARTEELIAAGFVFDSRTFSLTDEWRGNWLSLYVLNSFVPQWPVPIPDIDGNFYDLAQAELNNFMAAGFQAAFNANLTGTTLKASINAATTQAELDAVVDSR